MFSEIHYSNYCVMLLGWNCKVKVKDTNGHFEYSMDRDTGKEKLLTFNDNKMVGYDERKHEPNSSDMKVYSEMFGFCISDLEEEIKSNFHSIPLKETLVEYITGKYVSFKINIDEINKLWIPFYIKQKEKDPNFPNWWMQITEIHKLYLTRLLERFEANYGRYISKELVEGNEVSNKLIKDANSPRFNPDEIITIFEILKMYFSVDDQPVLNRLLTTGSYLNSPIVFRGSGTILCDFFKQLYVGQILTIAIQADLEKWISNNFLFLIKGVPTKITPKSASKIISGNLRAGKANRLINVERDKTGKLQIIKLFKSSQKEN